MRSFIQLLVAGGVVGGVRSAGLQVPTPVVTPGPSTSDVELLVKRQDPDAVSLAKVLLTAIPESLRQIAATNLPQVSSILWEEFLDNNKPQWFLDLPSDIQSYLIREFGPSTAWPTEPPASSGAGVSLTATATGSPEETSQVQSSETVSAESSSTQTRASSASEGPSTLATSIASSMGSPTDASSINPSDSPSSPTSTSDPDSPPVSSAGLSRSQKIGVGVGVPFALLGAAALAFGCCFLLRRRHKNKDGSVPPSSPGFIPRFAFQEKSTENLEHRTPLNRDINHSIHDFSHSDWDDDVIEPMNSQHRAHTYPPAVTMNDPTPIMAPALYHTHSSNRARGKRTSYTSLHSVAEVSEPDEVESPILGRHTSPKQSPHRRNSSRNLIPPPMPIVAQIKRKPVPTSPTAGSPAAQAASQTLLRQTMPEHSGSSSSGLAMSGFNTSSSSGLGLGNHTEVTSPVSPISDRAPTNPFANDYSYVEDYGPEYHGGYVDIEDGLYGGHTSLSRYPEPRRSSFKTEWPLRNIVGSGHRRNKSPLWDRVYEG